MVLAGALVKLRHRMIRCFAHAAVDVTKGGWGGVTEVVTVPFEYGEPRSRRDWTCSAFISPVSEPVSVQRLFVQQDGGGYGV